MAQSQSEMKTDDYVEQAIVQLLALKIRDGASTPQLKLFANECLQQAIQWSKTKPAYRGLDIHRLGSVLRSWHKETEYLTPDGLPRPLSAQGRTSLKSLVSRFYPAEKFAIVFKKLLETKLIKKLEGRKWVPSGRTARIPQVSHETLEHVAEGVARYIETVTKNVTAKSEQDVLFERSCKVKKLPAEEFGAFRDYVGQQALAFLTSVDDWLESRSSKLNRSKGRHCTAGVYTFAFIAEENKRARLRRGRRPRAT